MPWELTIQSFDSAPLGDVTTVREKIAAALPATDFFVEQSGSEKIAAARALGIEFPDVVRAHLENRPASLQAEFEGDGYTLQLYGFENQPLRTIYAEVRGAGNPLPALAALCRPNGWIANDCASGQPIDLTQSAAAVWETFRNYRVYAVRNILRSEDLA